MIEPRRPLHRCPQAGFTLIELLVVMSVIAALAGLSFAVYTGVFKKSEDQKTRMAVDAVVAAIETHRTGAPPLVRLQDDTPRYWWDIDFEPGKTSAANKADVLNKAQQINQLLIDGDPDFATPGTTLADPTLVPEDYRGLGNMLRLPSEYLNDRGEVVDAWGQPLHIAYDNELFSTTGYGVWSVGEDGISDPFNEASGDQDDDICSWQIGREQGR